jgi:hypothetical protein
MVPADFTMSRRYRKGEPMAVVGKPVSLRDSDSVQPLDEWVHVNRFPFGADAARSAKWVEIGETGVHPC